MADTDPTTETEPGGLERLDGPTVSDAVRSTESYKTDDGVVFYDAENPLSWMQADHAVDLDSSA